MNRIGRAEGRTGTHDSNVIRLHEARWLRSLVLDHRAFWCAPPPGRPPAAERGPDRPGDQRWPPASLEYALHGRSIGGESPLEEEVVLTPSRRQLRRREAEWEGSPRRTPAPRYTNRVEGGAIWVSLLKKVKPVTINMIVT